MIVEARTVTPKEAHEIGLVDRLFPDAAALEKGALEYAAKLAAGPTEAIGHAKVAAVLGFGASMEAGLAIEREAIARIFASEDAEEGIKAFTEKRKAEFKGR
jgi:enoyl-CoA hydratase/carnithine racemase